MITASCMMTNGAMIVIANHLFDIRYIIHSPLRHNKRKHKMTKERKGSEHRSDDSISTVLEEDEEDNDDGLQSLLENFLESSSEHDTSSASAQRRVDRLPRDDSGGPNRAMPRTHRNDILESLDASNAPVELRHATALLLQSSLLDESTARLLTSDILNQPLEVGERGEEPQKVETTLGFDDPTNLSVNDNRGSFEEAGLPGSNTTTALRPSIFTMHSMPPSDQ